MPNQCLYRCCWSVARKWQWVTNKVAVIDRECGGFFGMSPKDL